MVPCLPARFLCPAGSLFVPSRLRGGLRSLQGPPQNNIYTLARAPRGRMLGGATQAMPLCIVEERQQRRRPLAAAPLRAAALGACSKVQMLLCGGPLPRKREEAK